MKAVVYESYGGAEVLQLTEVEKPVAGKDDILIKIYATSVTAGDWRLRKADPFLARLFNGLIKPRRVKILGFELSGIVEEVGASVQSFKKGDAVFAFCGLKFGGYAEYQCLTEKNIIALKPSSMSFEEAATVPMGSLTALCFLRKATVSAGQSILIYGASGSVGTFAVQLARNFGANVTAVCSSGNTTLVKALGADRTIDYTTEDFTATGLKFDIIFDAVGKTSKAACRRLLKPGSKYISVKKQVKPVIQDLLFIKKLIEEGRLTTVIDRIYNIDEIQEAHRYAEQFRKRGNVAVRIKNE